MRSADLALALVVGLLGHAPVQAVDPVANRNLSRAPISVSIRMGDAGIGTGPRDYIRVLDSRGVHVAGAVETRAQGDSTVLTAPLSVRGTGWYVVHWNVESSDGHLAGGDQGGWWAFGYKGQSLRVAAASSVKLAPSNPGGVPLISTLSGRRTGIRTITIQRVSGYLVSVKWRLMNSLIDGTPNATFDWQTSTNIRSKTAAATGIIPVPGIYKVYAVLRTSGKNGTRLSTYEASVGIT